MRQVSLYLNISPEELLKYYSGKAGLVFTRALDGRSIQFPANILRPYVDKTGVHGYFLIEFDENNKFLSIKKLK